MPVFSLNNDIVFPHPDLAREDGLLAVGGDLSIERLLLAYENGIFPWFNAEDPPLWWSPPGRAVIFLEEFKASKSLKQEMRKPGYEIKYNTHFEDVILNCKDIRRGDDGSWITDDIITAYMELHEMGIAHSVETYYEGKLIGGLYGLVMGRVFCGESMFSKRSNGSKIALYDLTKTLQKNNFKLIDCQITNPHLESLGCREIPRDEFLSTLYDSFSQPPLDSDWYL